MNATNIKEARLQSWIKKLEIEVEKCLVSFGWENRIVSCPEDLYDEIKEHFISLSYSVWRERYEHHDMEGYPTGEYGYHMYIGLNNNRKNA